MSAATTGATTATATAVAGGKSASRREGSVHPMVGVPDAIRTVLRETARIILSGPTGSSASSSSEECIPVHSATLSQLYRRILARDVIQRDPGYPPYRASIMDGYAIHSSSSSRSRAKIQDSSTAMDGVTWTHQVMGKVLTGDDVNNNNNANADTDTITSQSALAPAHYVTTGAMVPDAYDCVVPIENCRILDLPDGRTTWIAVRETDCVADQWIRPPGCDAASGSVVLPAGHVLDAVALGLLLQSGVTHVYVHVQSPLVVGVLSTGNELEEDDCSNNNNNNNNNNEDAWERRRKGIIPDVNRPILIHLLQSWGCSVVDLGIIRDTDPTRLAHCLQGAITTCDFIITTGGISVGETDIVEQVLMEQLHGQLHFGRLNMKPGKPTTFITIPRNNDTNNNSDSISNSTLVDRLVFCMPGNPVSAAVCTHLLVRPCMEFWSRHRRTVDHDILADGGDYEVHIRDMVETAWLPGEVEAILTHDVKLDRERPEYIRVILRPQEPSNHTSNAMTYQATSTGVQRSSRLASMLDAQGLLLLPQGTAERPIALAGEAFLVLWMGPDNPLLPSVQVRSSRHLALTDKSRTCPIQIPSSSSSSSAFQVGLVLLNCHEQDSLTKLTNRIPAAMSDSVAVVTSHLYNGPAKPEGDAVRDWQLYDLLTSKKIMENSLDKHHQNIDCWILITAGSEAVLAPNSTSPTSSASSSSSSSFCYHTTVANILRFRILTKTADAMALQVRQGAAAQDPLAAMYEVVVGYLPSVHVDVDAESDDDAGGSGTMVLMLSEKGWEGGLTSIRGILHHALRIARGVLVTH